MDEVDVENGTENDYDREAYMPNERWQDDDADCQNTRAEVLIDESQKTVTFRNGSANKNCLVDTGLWLCPYSGQTFTLASELQIDHVVALKEVHQSGGYDWLDKKKQKYANDMTNPNHLIAVKTSENASKGHRDPAEWLPSDNSFRCEYIRIWIDIKRRWNLSIDPAEATAIRSVLKNCP